MFTPAGKVVQPAEAFYKRSILLLRGSFRPVTNVTVDMLNRTLDQFIRGAWPTRARTPWSSPR